MGLPAVMRRPGLKCYWIAAPLAVMVVGCQNSGTRGKPEPATKKAQQMADSETKIPNYTAMPASPGQDGPGVTIILDAAKSGGVYAKDEPVILHGKYGADAEMNEKCEGEPLTKIIIRVARRSDPDFSKKVLKDAHVMPPPSQRGSTGKGDFVIYGYFNIDVRKYSNRIKDPGKYWVQAELLGKLSDKLEFEIAEK